MHLRFAGVTALAVGILAAGCAQITPETKAEEASWLTLQVLDTAQTANIATDPNLEEGESAWIIGRKPSRRTVYAYMGGMAVLHVAIASYMDAYDWPRWERRLFEALTLADASQCVIGNYRAGLAVRF